MLKVRKIIVPGFATTAAALGGLSGALPGCAAETEPLGSTEAQEITAAQAGTGVLKMLGFSAAYKSTSGGDEFIRTGERLKAEILFTDVSWLFSDADRSALTPSNLKITAIATFLDKRGAVASTEEVPLAWAVTAGGTQVGASDEFVVPAGVPALKLDYRVEAPTATFVLSERLRMPAKTFPIFGAFLPDKLVLFDNDPSGAKRSRIVEFGDFKAGSGAMLSYADWRADRVVDRARLGTVIGKQRSAGRFGPVVVDAYGEVEYEISAAYGVDGVWQGTRLERHGYPAVMQTQADIRRSAYEAKLKLPASARDLRVAFNIKAFLKVPNYAPGEVFEERYHPGARVLLAETWDNGDGADYRFPVR